MVARPFLAIFVERDWPRYDLARADTFSGTVLQSVAFLAATQQPGELVPENVSEPA
jgi:hypothetical protein